MSLPSLPRLVRAFSFDLFDTLLGRYYLRPEDLFLRLATVAPFDSVESFSKLRKSVEFKLRQDTDFQREVTLGQIYDALAARLGWDQSTRSQALNAELKLEEEAIYTIPQGLKLLAEARARGKCILFISDTYLPRKFLENRLKAMGVLMPEDHCYFSSEFGHMKSTGALFEVVAKEEGLAPGQIVHIGDNPVSDVAKAKESGFRPVAFQPTLPTRYEEAPTTTPLGDDLTLSLYNGTRRKLRLNAPDLNPHQSIIYETTLAVSAPLIVTYTAWCLRQAQQRGLNRLYFLARDGEILHQTAKRLGPHLAPDVRLNYLYASRQALLLPAILGDLEPELVWILARTALLTPRIALLRVGLKPEQATSVLSQAGFPSNTWDLHLTDEARQRFGACLLSPSIADQIRAQAQAARLTATAYFQQEGLCNDPNFAVVDVGWNGTLQRSISRLLEQAGCAGPVTGLYFGLHSRRMHKSNDVMLACMSDYQNPTRLDSIDYLIPLLELFFAASHGGVTGYTRDQEGRIGPVLRDQDNSSGARWGLSAQHRGILDLAAVWANFPELLDPASLRDIMTDRLELFARMPSHAEAKAYGAFLDSEDQNEAVYVPLAKPYSWKELKDCRDRGIKHHHNEWRAGAIALTPAIYRHLLHVQNYRETSHPVCGQNISIVDGFGPIEGPLAQFHLPRFTWLYGPRGRITIAATELGDRKLRLKLKNFHGNQQLTFVWNNAPLTTLEVPTNFGENRTDSFCMEVVLPLRPGSNPLEFRPSHWSDGDRPLAIIICSIELT